MSVKAKYEKRVSAERRVALLAFTRPELGVLKSYYKKAIIYGKYIDVYEYGSNKVTHSEKNRVDYNKKNDGYRRKSSFNRARQEIYRIVEANEGKFGEYRPIFFTLTFRKNVTNLRKANRSFKYFIKKLNAYVKFKIKYIVVPEFQKRGAVHYHGIFFNMPFIDIDSFKKIWSYGFIDLQVTRDMRSVGAYIAKYMTKSTYDKRLYGEKAYFGSRGLFRPIHIYGSNEVDILLTGDIIELSHYEQHNCKYIKYARGNLRHSLGR